MTTPNDGLPPVRHRARPSATTSDPAPSPPQPSNSLPPVRQRVRPAPSTPEANAPPPPEPIGTLESTSDQTPEEYAVGYKKPPKHSQFRKGQSGNPKGRPRGAKSMDTIALETLTERVTVRTSQGEKKITRMQALFLKQCEAAMKGNPRAFGLLTGYYAAGVAKTTPQGEHASEQDFSATDLAVLDAYKALLLGDGEVQ